MKKMIGLLALLFVFNHSFSQTLQTVTSNGNSTSKTIEILNGAYLNVNSGNISVGDAKISLSAFGNHLNGGYAVIQPSYHSVGYDIPLVLNNQGGNVGIGTTSPGHKLDVRSAGPNGLRVSTGDNQYVGGLTWNTGTVDLSAGGYGVPDLRLLTDGVERLRILTNGSVGVGTASPTAKLDVAGVLQTRNLETAGAYWDNLQLWSDGANSYIQSNGDENGLKIKSVGGNKILFESKVGIGTEQVNDNNFNLFVEKGILTRKIKVSQQAWADYVFDSSYQLPSLSHVETFIKENKHLPEVPSAAEVKKDGLDLGDNQAVLLKKIEELTLYIIQQNKKMEQMEKRLAEVESKQSN